MDESRFGDYTCRAGNSVGSTDFQLELLDPATLTEEGAQYQSALVGGIVAAILICVILLLISKSRASCCCGHWFCCYFLHLGIS